MPVAESILVRRSHSYMAERGLIVEFIGVPGAGKTSLAAALAAELSGMFDVGQPQYIFPRGATISLIEKLRLDLTYAPSFMMYRIRRLLFDLRRTGPGIWTASNSWKQSRYPVFLVDKIARTPKEIYVLDEWLLHRIIGEAIARYDSDLSFATKFAIPYFRTHRLMYIHVCIDSGLALQRILAQDQPFRTFAREKNSATISRVLASWTQQIEQLRAEIERRRIPCIDIDGNASIDANVKVLVGWLLASSQSSNEATKVEQR